MRLKIYEGRRGLSLRKQWRWRVVASNGQIVAHGGEGYNNRADALRGIEIVRQTLQQDRPLRPRVL